VVLISDVAVGDEGPRVRDPALGLSAFRSWLYGCFGRRPDYRSVARVLEEEPVPLKMVRNYPPYHEARDVREARAAIVELRLSGWSVKAIAGYLGVHHSTVYRTLDRWKEKGFEGLSDGTLGRPPGIRKANFAAVLLEVRKPTLFETLFADPRGGRLAQGPPAGGLRAQEFEPPEDAAAGPLRLHGRRLATRQ
jgi:hypothetical protein